MSKGTFFKVKNECSVRVENSKVYELNFPVVEITGSFYLNDMLPELFRYVCRYLSPDDIQSLIMMDKSFDSTYNQTLILN